MAAPSALTGPLPHATPSWLTPRRAVTGVAAIAGAITACPLVAALAPMPALDDLLSTQLSRYLLEASTFALAGTLAHLAVHAPTLRRALAWCMVGGAVAGFMNACLSVALIATA